MIGLAGGEGGANCYFTSSVMVGCAMTNAGEGSKSTFLGGGLSKVETCLFESGETGLD